MAGPDKRTFSVLTFGPAPWFVALLVTTFVLTGCVRSVTEEDCKSLGAHVHAVWLSEAQFPRTPTPTGEKAVAVIKSEGVKLDESVVAACKRDYLGKPKASGEFSCLSRASTVADVQACATIPAH